MPGLADVRRIRTPPDPREEGHLAYAGQDATHFAPESFFPMARIWEDAMRERDRALMVDRARRARPEGTETVAFLPEEIERQRR